MAETETKSEAGSNNDKSNKIGVFVCGCRGEVSDKIDLDSLVDFIKKEPNVSVVKIHEAICSSTGQEFLNLV